MRKTRTPEQRLQRISLTLARSDIDFLKEKSEHDSASLSLLVRQCVRASREREKQGENQ